MTRKEFLKIAAGAAVVPAVAFMSSCKSSTTTTPPTGDSKTFTSTSVQSHTHTVTLTKTEIESGAGLVKTTSSSGGHTHTFAMTAIEGATVKGGTAIAVDTTIESVAGYYTSHFHNFAIQKWY